MSTIDYEVCHYYEPNIEDFISCPVTKGEVLVQKGSACSECHHNQNGKDS